MYSRVKKPKLDSLGRDEIGREFKFYDDYQSLGCVNNTWTRFSMNGGDTMTTIPQGSGRSERIGKQIKVTGLHLKIQIYTDWQGASASALPSPTFELFVMLVGNTQKAVKDAQYVGSLSNGVISRNVHFLDVFKTLYRKRFQITKKSAHFGAASQTMSNMIYKEVYIPCNFVIDFNGLTGGVGEQTENSIQCYYYCGTQAGVNPVGLHIASRVYYFG